jgi:DNA-binding NtrC family response regulator
VYGIVKQAGGTVVIRSEQDTGTTVDVYLPAVLVPGTVPDDEPAKPTALDGSGERVLVVEDEDAVREVTVRTLARHGYDVLEASGPDGATAVWEEHEGEIDLVLTDVVMPGSSGKTLIEELRKRSPDIRFVYMSGYTDDVLVRHGTGATHTTLLEKPFSRDTLLRTVRDAIAGKVPA